MRYHIVRGTLDAVGVKKGSSTRALTCVVDSYPRLVSFDDAM